MRKPLPSELILQNPTNKLISSFKLVLKNFLKAEPIYWALPFFYSYILGLFEEQLPCCIHFGILHKTQRAASNEAKYNLLENYSITS